MKFNNKINNKNEKKIFNKLNIYKTKNKNVNNVYNTKIIVNDNLFQSYFMAIDNRKKK